MSADVSVDGVTVTVCPNGPLLVRGVGAFETADGTMIDNPRQVVALCRCGRSRVKPLCDGSHRAGRFTDRADAAEIADAVENATSRRER
jgi:CDGSH-type Zn-finger protein